MPVTYCNSVLATRRTVGSIQDATLIDGAVLNPNPATGLYTFSSILGTAHAGTPSQDQTEANTRMSGGWYDLLFYRSTTSRASWDANTVYEAAKFSAYKLYRRSNLAKGWSGHTFSDAPTNVLPNDDGTPANLVGTSFTLPWGLYFCVLTVRSGYADKYLRSNNCMDLITQPLASVTDEVLADFVTQFPGFPLEDNDEILAYTTPGGVVPLNQGNLAAWSNWGYCSTGQPTAGNPATDNAQCVTAAQVVRFRVNRLEWSN